MNTRLMKKLMPKNNCSWSIVNVPKSFLTFQDKENDLIGTFYAKMLYALY